MDYADALVWFGVAVAGAAAIGFVGYALGRKDGRAEGWLDGWRERGRSDMGGNELVWQVARAQGFHEGWADRSRHLADLAGKAERN